MTDRAYGYFKLNLFEGTIKLPLKLCTSYSSEDYMKPDAPTKAGVNGRPINRPFVQFKEGKEKSTDPADIESIVPWGTWTTYLNTGSDKEPILEPLEKYEGLKELLEQDKLKSKERDITTLGIFPKSKIKIHQYNGRHFHTYPHTDKDKTNEKFHVIYKILATYLKKNKCFMLCRFFSKGEELGALYEDKGTLRIAGLHATSDLKEALPIPEFTYAKEFEELAHEKFDKLKQEEMPVLVLEWRDHVQKSLQEKGVSSKGLTASKSLKKSKNMEEDLMKMFAEL